MSVPYQWWQRGIVYQVYPRSFLDSNGDGIGDLPGITEKLDYLQWLGIDAIWISPIFPSPMADFGYDVADYTGVEPMFGTLADFDTLLAEAHQRGLKVLLDFVPNHTSDQHPWFQEAQSSRANPKRDWYLWRDPAPDGGPPNNWQSLFRGSAWEYDATTGQYYCHLFLKEQPDLNWRNPAVQRAMFDSLRFWLDRGVDGFRVDVIWLMIKDDQYRDNPSNPEYDPTDPHSPPVLPVYTADRPEVHDIIAMMRGVLDEYGERVLIGEIYLPVDQLVTYYGAQGQGVNLPFNFHLILSDWNARLIATLIDQYEAALPPGGWPNWVIGNHDQSRIATRVGAAQARVAAMLLLTLRGTPTIYYGDEIGMHDIPIAPEQAQDPVAAIEMAGTRGEGRDPERTPMQWSAHANAGFTTGTPWLPIADDYETANVAQEGNDPYSMLTLHHRLIALRRATPALAVGRYQAVQANGDLLAYIREDDGQRYLVVLNLGGQPHHFAPETPINGTIVLTTDLDRAAEPVRDALDLRGDEGVVIALD
ncbi:MAG: alpha-amylase family glycosyl hydrolase [Thermomicrobiales bacterium]